MNDLNELKYILALQGVPKIGDVTAKKLIHHCGSAEAIFKEKRSNLLKIGGIGTLTLNNLQDSGLIKNAEAELQFIEENNLKCLYFQNEDYPKHLIHCVDGPILLFQAGNIQLDQRPIISIVGTRKITTNGITFCERLIDQLVPFDPIIVSGFAYGTDITAHKLALKHGLQTIGCLAHGLNQFYPRSHKRYVVDIENNGGFLTDFWSTDSFDRNNFLKRNRIIAGISEATVVIESAEKGGSLVTADIANSYNRDVFAVPGRITDIQSTGCNNLIKYQQAHMLTNPMDIPYLLNWNVENRSKDIVQKDLFTELSEEEQTIYDYLLEQDKSLLDIIALECDLPVYKTASILLNLELKGVVKPLPGKQFRLF